MIDCLDAAERARLEELLRRDPFVRETLDQVHRVLTSRQFSRVQQRTRDFLIFVVAKTLLGQTGEVKESTIAIAVFEKDAGYDSKESSLVRTAAASLREKLLDYAAHEGKGDALEITIPVNTYIPIIRDRRPTLAVVPFENWHPQLEQPHLCATIVERLAYQLEKAGMRVRLGPLIALSVPGGCRFTLRGSVEVQDERVRVNFALSDATNGRRLLSDAVEGQREELMALTRHLGELLLDALKRVDERGGQGATMRRRA
jgi:TolB-like protein